MVYVNKQGAKADILDRTESLFSPPDAKII